MSLPDTYINQYIKQIITAHNGDEVYLKKIDNNTYYDLISINCYKETLKKEQVSAILEKFSYQASEAIGLKFYIIKGIENSTKEAINSILKSLEEPLPGTYAILTTQNINKVISTITSRCQQIIIHSDYAQVAQLCTDYKLTEQEGSTITKIYWNIQEAISDLEDGNFKECYNLAMDILNFGNDLFKIKKTCDQFKKLEFHQIGLILKIINLFKKNIEISKMYDQLKLHTSKLLIFNHLLIQMQKKVN